jgi:hypothetical protein
MDAILISLFILSLYTIFKIGLRVYHVRQYLSQRSHRRGRTKQLQPATVLRAEFGSRYRQVKPARAS